MPTTTLEYRRAYYAKNKEKFRNYAKKWALKNPGRDYQKEYQKTYPRSRKASENWLAFQKLSGISDELMNELRNKFVLIKRRDIKTLT